MKMAHRKKPKVSGKKVVEMKTSKEKNNVHVVGFLKEK